MSETRQHRKRLESWLIRQSRRPGRWLAAAAVLLAVQISPYWQSTTDGGAYISIARNLAHGQLACYGSPHLHYAPGYSLLIAPLFWFGNRPILAIAVVQWLLAVCAMIGVYCWLRRVAPPAALWLTLLVASNSAFWGSCRETLSEMAFMAAVVWCAVVVDRARRPVASLGGAALCAMATLIRPPGVLLAGGFAAAHALRVRRGRSTWTRVLVTTAALAVPACLIVAALVARDRLVHSPQNMEKATYLDYVAADDVGPAQQVIEGVRLRICEVGRLTVPGMHKAYGRPYEWLNINVAVYLVVVSVIAIGWARTARRKPDTLLWMLPFHVALYIIWPFDQGTRFMMPMLPVLAVSLWPWAARLRGRRRSAIAILAAIHLCISVDVMAKELPTRIDDHRLWGAFDHMATIIGDDIDAVGTLDLHWRHCAVLSVALDRRAARDQPRPWIVTPETHQPDPGYESVWHGEGLQLLRRTPAKVE